MFAGSSPILQDPSATATTPMKMTSQTRALDKIYKRRNRYEIPEWQRGKVWDRAKKQKLIDTILRGWKLPKFYFLKTGVSPEEFEVLDGQQRLTAIFEFFDDELPLSEESTKEFGGRGYSDLPSDLSDNFDDFEIEYDEIEEAEEEEQREFFQRLQEGLPLTSSEKLNSAHSKLRDFCKDLSKHRFFTQKVTASDKRYGHFDIAAKVAAIAIEGNEAGLRYDDLKATIEAQKNFSTRSEVGKRLRATFDFLCEIFEDEDPLLKNRTVVQSFTTLVFRLLESGSLNDLPKRLREFFESFMIALSKQVELGHAATDPAFIEFQKTVNANVRGAARTRQQLLLRKLLVFDPKFADSLDPAMVAQSGLSDDIAQLGREIVAAIGRINDAYSAKFGRDLLKATNKTTQALSRLSKTVVAVPGYKDFIDCLYFIFHEGVGDRLDGKKPQSFVDINTLRTDLQHDVDHGKSSKVAAKRKRIGSTFAKYSGAVSPSTLEPERFPLVQDSILAAVVADLRALELAAATSGL
jgi:hypothetical protein